jgi:aerobic C4-dicarboxylate transport protein
VVPDIPVAGMALILGIDRFMSECRALTNFIGNGVAAGGGVALGKELDVDKMKAELANPGSTITDPEPMEVVPSH